MKKLIILQTATPDYRAGFFKYLRNSLNDKFELYGGDTYFEKSISSDIQIEKIKVKNHFILNRKLLFQTGIFHLVFKDIILILELNPRILSNWIILFLRKVNGKQTILWGHAWSRKGEQSKTEWLRNNMRKMATGIVVYTKKQKKELQKRMPSKKIYAAPNALLDTSKMQTSNLKEEFINIIYVGRLTPQKKPMFLVRAFKKGLSKWPQGVKLFLIGEGEEKEKVITYIKKHNLEKNIIIKGHISDYNELKGLYDKSFFSISPGYAGLSVTQSFGFGVPILVSKNENHSPEIEAVIPNENALFYETDNIDSFIEILNKAYLNRDYWILQRPIIVNFCKKEYSTESMAKVFIDLILKSES